MNDQQYTVEIQDGKVISVTCMVCGLLVPFAPESTPEEVILVEHRCD